MENIKVELAAAEMALLGEGPSWDYVNSVLYWIDGLGCKVFIYNPETGKNRAINVNQYVGSIAPVKNGGLITALKGGFYFLDTETEHLSLLVNPEKGMERNRFNDGKCDSEGRFWSGSMSMDEKGGKCDFDPTGALYRMDRYLSVDKVVDNVYLSNGLTWSIDNTEFYYIDTPRMQVDAFDYDSRSGGLSNRRKIIDFPHEEGFPDGMTIDQENMLWIGHYGGGRVSRWDPSSGKKIDEIYIPAVYVTSCTFGGSDTNDLYITTARVGMTQAELEKYPDAGGLFRVRLTVQGVPIQYFPDNSIIRK